jgi:predicted RNase H-like HicB family nuclease
MKSYLVILEKSATGYGAYVPDLPGCVATGPTRPEAEQLIREAIAFHMEGLVLDGLPVPEPTSGALEVAVA